MSIIDRTLLTGEHVCPWWLAYTFDNPLRRLVHNPEKMLGKYIKEGVVIAVIKFLIVPIVATSLAYMIGFGGINDGLPLKVVLILSCMPVGFTAMIPPTIYNLDIDLTNACWFVTTISLIFVIPVLQYLLKVL